MKKLHQLAKQLKENNFVMTEQIKEQFEEYLSIIAEGSRVLHPVFGLGTVTGTAGNVWVYVEFDKEIEEWEEEVKKLAAGIKTNMYWSPSKPSKMVMISSCTSIHMLIKKEMQRDIFGK